LRHRDLQIFAFVLVVAVFSPPIWGELITIDDYDMINWMQTTNLTLKELFLPSGTGGYYRPLIGVSYLFDKHVWALDTRLMHLDNIFFHLLNVFLVFCLTHQLLADEYKKIPWIPLTAALLFGLHPMTTESVNWISGRSDVMSCTFVLLSALFIVRFRTTRRTSWLVCAAVVLVAGVLVKETALAFILGGAFIVTAPGDADQHNGGEITRELLVFLAFALTGAVALLVTYNIGTFFAVGLAYLAYSYVAGRNRAARPRKGPFIIAILAALSAAGSFFAVRSLVYSKEMGSLSRTLKLIGDDLNYACQTFLGASGFYVKKFFFPLPLNFAIREIDPFYNLAGVVVFFGCLYLIGRGTSAAVFFLAGICMFLPVLPLSLGTITWTAYAERYIYISTAFWTIAVTLALVPYVSSRRAFVRAAVLLVCFCAAISFQRSITWKTNLALFQDTVSKSPTFKSIRVDYMLALMAAGDLEGAKEQYRIASSIPSVGYLEALDINFASIAVSEGKFDQAVEIYEKVIRKTKGKSITAYSCYATFLQTRVAEALLLNDRNSAISLGKRLVECNEALFSKSKDPHILYRTGQLVLALGDRTNAGNFFSRAAELFPAESEYSAYSLKLSASLDAKRNRQDRV